ncbi:MAG TPA: serine protease [Candidatus Sulfotelmatobacter sp.]|nr:serine protease [Candidatus Sulfotelmatobacter sp.]
MTHKFLSCVLVFAIEMLPCAAQESTKPDAIPVDVKWTLDAANPTQRTAIKSVILLVCPRTNRKGTGFLLSDGLIVTNNHVVEGCTAEEMKANPFGAQEFGFSKMAADKDVDLALLHPSRHLTGGLELGSDTDKPLATPVTTWGFPLTYNGLLLFSALGTSRVTSRTERAGKK